MKPTDSTDSTDPTTPDDRDLSRQLSDWPFDPHELNVRVVTGVDGEPKVQLRVELGILQMNRDGRPDGRTFGDCESMLDFLEASLAADEELSAVQLEELYREGLQYYRRYLAFHHLEWYELLVRDTDRNLRLLAYVGDHTRKKRDKWRLDQFRPYLLMMNARGRALAFVEVGDRQSALQATAEGRRRIEEFLREYGRTPDDIECRELDLLKRFEGEIEAGEESPGLESDRRDARKSLETRLQAAVDQEDYERAALLRDRLRQFGAPTVNDEDV